MAATAGAGSVRSQELLLRLSHEAGSQGLGSSSLAFSGQELGAGVSGAVDAGAVAGGFTQYKTAMAQLLYF